ncbi:unnamed protein product [Brassica rapa subsp. narinosa]|uniref:Uncharacterized protein n=1 Tax=Brassica campestris TaxID=3711 RepID=A0A3P6AHA0_BRACM|nr:unnamed protein product [Brassica rapa]
MIIIISYHGYFSNYKNNGVCILTCFGDIQISPFYNR